MLALVRSKFCVITLGGVTGVTVGGLWSTLLLLLLLQLPVVETSLSSPKERDTFLLVAADEHFRRSSVAVNAIVIDSSSGLPRTKDGCAYMSVSGPRRTLEKPYCQSREGKKQR